MDLISIVIPIYKVEKYLDKCVESVVNQSYKNLEIILVDDGSPDNCPEICDEWAKKDKRIKVIHKENGGLSDARNFGIEVATGEYLMFLDSDDSLDLSTCEKLLKLIKGNDVDFSMCDCKLVYEDKTDEETLYEITTKKFFGDDVMDQLYYRSIPYLMIPCAKLYKKHIFNNIRYPKGRFHEDEFVIHEVLYNSKSFAYTNEQLYLYLQRGGSIMGSKKEKNMIDTLCAYRNRVDFLNEKMPQNKQKTLEWYLKTLRSIYICNNWISKKIKKEILVEYKKEYKNKQGKSKKDMIFYCFPRTSSFIMRMLKKSK